MIIITKIDFIQFLIQCIQFFFGNVTEYDSKIFF